MHSNEYNVYAVEAASGTQRWRFEAEEAVTSSPAIVDGSVYIGSGDVFDDECCVYALNAALGTEQWRFAADGPVTSSPAVVDGTVYVGSDDGHVYAVDAASGTEQWCFETDGQVRSSPVVVDGTVYVAGGGTVYALAGTGTEVFGEETEQTGTDTRIY
ncbi:outer membrane protein assembly factor BamB family protein [Halobellus marinus]|uniref:outer membrane protein assembly factor BamB family protein n=1 Tax=Halobellus sp. GCM10025813 TaxID=3252665 RepID=UPI00360B80D0